MPSAPSPADESPPAPPVPGLVVVLFAGMAEALGARRIELPWTGGTVGDLRRVVAAAHPTIAPLLARSAVCVAGLYAPDGQSLPVGADVALIPPVSGG